MEITYCLVGISLLFSSIYMHFLKDETNFTRFVSLLNQDQMQKYNSIVHERLRIYIQGIFLGIILGLLYIKYYGSNICVFLTIIFITKLTFYKIYPKSTMMLYHLTNKEQTDAWTDIYVHMKSTWLKSIILGVLSYIFLYYSFLKK
tara:strand:- start:188 stop:625 length:438 start_codon:yes stop_codon:yes gene_type:complete